MHIGETYQAESWDWRDAVQIYVRPWWHYSCDLHFKPATEVAPDFKQAILHQNQQDSSWQLSQWEGFCCWCSSWLCSDSTALNCYLRGSYHGIQNKLHIVAVVQIWSGDQDGVHGGIAGENWCMEVLEGEGSSCEHNNMKLYTNKVVPWAKLHQMPVTQHYLMMEDGGDSTW